MPRGFIFACNLGFDKAYMDYAFPDHYTILLS